MRVVRVPALWLLSLAALGAQSSSADTIDQSASQAVPQTSAAPAAQESAIATRVKARLAARHLAVQVRVKAHPERDGIIWLSGTVTTLDAAAQATQAAMETEGVVAVHNAIVVQ